MTTTLDDRRSDTSATPPDHRAANRWLGLGAIIFLLLGVLGGMWIRRDRIPAADSVDIGFLQDMTTHHDQAVEMSSLAVTRGVDATVLPFALEVIKSQRWELGRMYAWLQDWGYDSGDDERTDAMAWMGHPVPLASMAGMQSQADIDRLADGPVKARSELYLRLMISHHQGAVHMAEEAAEHAETAKVRLFAQATAANQAKEIHEFEATLAALQAS
jgi:uncharacterized protein (DUF305 family)